MFGLAIGKRMLRGVEFSNVKCGLRGRTYFNILGNTGRLGNRFTELAQGLEVARDRFPDIPLSFLQGPSGCHAAWQIRNICGPVRFRSLENDGVFSVHSFSSKIAAL